MVYVKNGILFTANRALQLSSTEKTWRNLKYILLSERSKYEMAMYCMILIELYMTCGKGKTMEKGQWLPWIERDTDEEVEQENFQGNTNSL